MSWCFSPPKFWWKEIQGTIGPPKATGRSQVDSLVLMAPLRWLPVDMLPWVSWEKFCFGDKIHAEVKFGDFWFLWRFTGRNQCRNIYTIGVLHQPGCQSPPGPFHFFAGEIRNKPSFATGILSSGISRPKVVWDAVKDWTISVISKGVFFSKKEEKSWTKYFYCNCFLLGKTLPKSQRSMYHLGRWRCGTGTHPTRRSQMKNEGKYHGEKGNNNEIRKNDVRVYTHTHIVIY